MTDLVRRFIKTAILFLVLGLLTGATLLVRRELFGDWPSAYSVSAHTHAVFVGFVMFMILGVALWIFPKPLQNDRRYRPAWIETAYWVLLVGTLARFVGELLQGFSDLRLLAWLTVVGGLAQLAGLLLYVWTMWSRIRPSARQLRSSRGGDAD